jgi:hypothetical protein
MTIKVKETKWFDSQKIKFQRIRFILSELDDLFESLEKYESDRLLEEIVNTNKKWNS